MARKIYAGKSPSGGISLPDGYTQLTYLEGTGTQYIDTLIKPNSNTTLEVKFSTSERYYNGISVVDLGWQTTGFGIGGNAFQWGTTVNSSQSWGDGNQHTVVVSPSGVTLDGSSIATFSNSSWSIDYNLPLFALNRSGEIQEFSKSKIYYCKILENGTLVRHYIPCKSPSNELGMFDIVNSTFYTNIGTGTFVGGTELVSVAKTVKAVYAGRSTEMYTPIEYVECTGAQYIDTGFKPNQNTRVVIDFESTSTNRHIFGSRTSFRSKGFLIYWASNSDYCVQIADTTYNGGTFTTTGRHVIDMSASEFKLDDVSKATYSVGTFQTEYNLYLASCPNSEQSENMTGKIYSAKVYDNGVLIRNYTPMIDKNGVACLYDSINNNYNYSPGGSNFGAGPVNGAPITIGEGVAKRVTKVYAGVGGVARPVWGESGVVNYGAITTLSVARPNMASTSIGNFALFGGGGKTSSSGRTEIDVYNDSLTKLSNKSLKRGRHELSAASNGSYAIFAEGLRAANTAAKCVEAFDASLTSYDATSLNSSYGYIRMASTSIGNFALFGGGHYATGNKCLPYIYAYDKSLTLSSPTGFGNNYARMYIGATSTNTHALFAGGYSVTEDAAENDVYNYFDRVDVYDQSLTRTTATLSQGRYGIGAVSRGDYAIFAGGVTSSSNVSSVVDVFDKSLTRTTHNLDISLSHLTTAPLKDYAILAGGNLTPPSVGGSSTNNIVFVYDKSLTRTINVRMNTPRREMFAATVGEFAIFAGGIPNGTYSDTTDVEAFTVM